MQKNLALYTIQRKRNFKLSYLFHHAHIHVLNFWALHAKHVQKKTPTTHPLLPQQLPLTAFRPPLYPTLSTPLHTHLLGPLALLLSIL